MRELNKINAAPKQLFRVIGENGERIRLALNYSPTQQKWFFDMRWNDWTINGAVLCLSPNILRSYKRIIPFGLSCIAEDAIEPTFIDDFETGRVRLILLNAEEVREIEEALFLP